MLTHIAHTNWQSFWQTTFSNAFSWMEMIEFRFKLHSKCSMFLTVQLTISQHWFRPWPGAEPLSEPTLSRFHLRIYAALGGDKLLYHSHKTSYINNDNRIYSNIASCNWLIPYSSGLWSTTITPCVLTLKRFPNSTQTYSHIIKDVDINNVTY